VRTLLLAIDHKLYVSEEKEKLLSGTILSYSTSSFLESRHAIAE